VHLAQIFAALLDEARRPGVHRVVLETGTRQDAALARYRRLGFTEVPCRGDDAAGPLSVCFTRTVDPAVHREPSAAPVRTEP